MIVAHRLVDHVSFVARRLNSHIRIALVGAILAQIKLNVQLGVGVVDVAI